MQPFALKIDKFFFQNGHLGFSNSTKILQPLFQATAFHDSNVFMFELLLSGVGGAKLWELAQN
jgi:hypothetical protein